MDDAPPQENGRVGQIRQMVLRGLFSCLPKEKGAKPNIAILIVFLVSQGLLGVP